MLLSILSIFLFCGAVLSYYLDKEVFKIILGAIFAVIGSAIIFLLNQIVEDVKTKLIRNNLIKSLILEIKQNIKVFKELKSEIESGEKDKKKLQNQYKIQRGSMHYHLEPNFYKYYTFTDNNLVFYKSYVSYISTVDTYWEKVIDVALKMKSKYLSIWIKELEKYEKEFSLFVEDKDFNKDKSDIDYNKYKEYMFKSIEDIFNEIDEYDEQVGKD